MARLLQALLVLALAGMVGAYAADEEGVDTGPAMRAMEAWLSVLDEGRYGTGWESAAAYLREGVPKLRFETAIQAVREPLGIVVSRKIRTAQHSRVLPGAPPGDYVVMQFTTRFANGPPVVETVTAIREPDGAWKAAGYFIR